MTDQKYEEELERHILRKEIENQNSKKTIKKLYGNQKMINGYTLEFDIAFGINYFPISNHLMLLGDGLVLFSAGTTIVVKDIASRTNMFFAKEGRFKNITALAAIIKKKGNLLIAAGESTLFEDKPAIVSVISSKKNKWFTLAPNMKGIVKHICLNSDKKYCAYLLHLNNNTLHIYFWNYRKERLLTTTVVKASVDKFTLHPLKPKNLILAGNSYLRMWENHFQERTIKESATSLVSLKIEKENKFLDHTWIINEKKSDLSRSSNSSPYLLVLASGNKVFIIQNEDLKKVVELDTLNLNIIEVNVEEAAAEDTEDIYGINNIIEDLSKDKPLTQTKEVISNTIGDKIENPNARKSIEFCCITSTKKGFIVGGSKGCLSFYDLEKNFMVIHTLSFQMKFLNQEDNRIVFMSSSSQDSLISIVSNFGNSNLNFSMLNTYHLDLEMSPIQPFFPTGFHTKKVNSISCSTCKSIFATCSEDNTVKIWNYYDSETSEKKGIISQSFKDEPISLSLHPSGLFLAVCFTNCVKVFGVLSDSFFPIKEINLTNCKIVKYSHGGSFLMTNEKSNVLIIDSIYYETLYILDGHTALIKDACISDDDLYIVSTCMSGYVYCWSLVDELGPQQGVKSQEHQESTIYNSIQFDYDCYDRSNPSDLFVGCTNDKYLIIYKKFCKEIIAEFPTTDCYITSLLVSRKLGVLFMGTNKGSIRLSLWPMNDDTMEWEAHNFPSFQVKFKLPEFYEVQAHSAAVSSLCLSHDLNYLFSGGEDGTIFVLKLKPAIPIHETNHFEIVEAKKNQEKNNNTNTVQHKIEEKIKDTHSLNELFLAKVLKILDKNETIKQLTFQVIKFDQKVKIETQRIDINYKKNMDQIETDFQTSLENDRKIKEAFEAKSNEDLSALMKLFEQERKQFESELESLKKEHSSKVEYENTRNQELESNIEVLKTEQQEELKKMLEKHKDDLKILSNVYREKCEKIQVKFSNVVDNAKNFGNAFIQRLDKEDQEHELELDDQIKELQEKKNKAKNDNINLDTKETNLKKKNADLQLLDSNMQKELAQLLGDFNKIRIDNVKNDEDIIKMNHQLVERLQVIESKEETCKAARDEQINLENFRYMLDQKIKMLQNEKTQILGKISEKEKNLKNMFNELIKESNQNENKFQFYKKQLVEMDILDESVKKSDLSIFLNSNVLNSYRTNLLTIIKHPDKMVPMAERLQKMLEKSKDDEQLKSITNKRHIDNKDINDVIRVTNEKGDDINDEIFKQGKWMAKKHFLIKKTCDQLEDIRDRNMVCVLNQNTKLIEECNDLRAENDKYRKMMRNVEKLLAEAIRKKQKLQKKKREQQTSPQQMKLLAKKYEENSQKLRNQNKQLVELKDSVNEIIQKQTEEDSTRLPPIGKTALSLTNQTASNVNIAKKNEILVEDRLK